MLKYSLIFKRIIIVTSIAWSYKNIKRHVDHHHVYYINRVPDTSNDRVLGSEGCLLQ